MSANIFYINKNKFLMSVHESLLDEYSNGRVFKSAKRKLQFCIGRFLIKHVLKNYYKLEDEDTELIIKNKKPCLKNGSVHFSLSHSEDIILCAFSYYPIGADIEFMKERDFTKLQKRYKFQQTQNIKESFYKFWTKYEAKIKLQQTPVSEISMKLFDDYFFTLCSSDKTDKIENIKITEIIL